MKIVWKKLSQVIPYDRNPRLNDGAVAAVAASIREFGFRQPIVVDAQCEIVAGDTRYKAAQQLGLDKVPVVVADDLTPEQIRAYRIADNKTGELAAWDFDLLATECSELKDADFDLSLLAFSDKELAQILKDSVLHPQPLATPAVEQAANAAVEGLSPRSHAQAPPVVVEPGSRIEPGFAVKPGLCDPDDVPARPNEPDDVDDPPLPPATTQWGDLWLLGEHRLLCGGTRSPDYLDRLLDGAAVHLVYVDPPRNGRDAGYGEANPCFEGLVRGGLANAAGALVPGGTFYIWGGDRGADKYQSVLTAAGLHVAQTLIWVTPRELFSTCHFKPKHRWCFYGWRHGADPRFFGPNDVPDVWWVEKKCPRDRLHSIAQPVDFAVRAMQWSSREGENVLDLSGQAGSTLIAAEMTARRAFLIEGDPYDCDVIVRRWERFTGRQAQRQPA